MDSQDNSSGDTGLTDDEKLKVGLQQAALIQMQEMQHQQNQDDELRARARRQQMMIEQQKEQELMEAQQKALQQQMRIEQERQQVAETINLQLQAHAIQERQKEEELKRLQERAMMERHMEEQQHEPPAPPQPPRLLPLGTPHMSAPPRFPMSGPPGQLGPPRMGPPIQPGQGGPPSMNRPPGSLPPPPIPHISGGPMPPHPPFSQSQPMQQMPPQMQPPVRGPPPPLMQQQPQRPGPPPMGQSGMPPSSGPPHGGPRPGGMPPQQGGMPPMTQAGMPPNNQQGMRRDGPPMQPGPDNRGRPPPLMGMETRRPGPVPDDDEEQNQPRQQQGKPEEEEEPEFKLPQALEKVLAFKDVRVQEVGVKPEEMERMEKGEIIEEEPEEEELESRQQMRIEDYVGALEEEEDDEEEEEVMSKAAKKSESKNKRRKKKKKRAKQRKAEQQNTPAAEENKEQSQAQDEEDENIEIEYVVEEISLDRTEPSYREFNKIFQAFKIAEPEKSNEGAKTDDVPLTKAELQKSKISKPTEEEKEYENIYGTNDSDEETKEDDSDKPKLSKKKMKKLNRLSVAELKQLVTRPDVVEMHDVTARDPKLLVSLKATRNSVPVPRHWCFKRKYLQGKRGIEKPPFDLPDFIKNTGIMEMRQALQEKEEAKNLKAKMREKVRPKMGKIDIDYQKLHDAFFKYQTKPKMTIHGDLYYEGKEFETRLKEKKPGNLTDDIRTALGMPIGSNADKYPPPWLIAMQRYGPPPSYPNLKIPGLNGPIPEGCSFGYHAGGWGKPPVDENGKPLYGDVFGTQGQEVVQEVEEEEADRTRWGELESESEEESESESESEEEGEAADSGLVTPGDPGLVTPSGVTSVPIGMETPDMIELRKKRIEDAMDQGGDTPALYQVLPEKKTNVGAAMMGSAHVYDIAAVPPPVAQKSAENPEGVEVALNPDELDLDTAAMQAKYEQQVREQQSQLEKEDLSDMVADHQAKQAKKRKKQQDTGKSAKKYKEFKF